MEESEDLDAAMEKFGPPYKAHWDAWKAISTVTFKDITLSEHLDLMEVEACTTSMLYSMSPGLLPELEKELNLMKVGLINRVAKERPNPRDLIALVRDARINHWRKFPHPPEMKKQEPEGING